MATSLARLIGVILMALHPVSWACQSVTSAPTPPGFGVFIQFSSCSGLEPIERRCCVKLLEYEMGLDVTSGFQRRVLKHFHPSHGFR
jgi:hypothetical protein